MPDPLTRTPVTGQEPGRVREYPQTAAAVVDFDPDTVSGRAGVVSRQSQVADRPRRDPPFIPDGRTSLEQMIYGNPAETRPPERHGSPDRGGTEPLAALVSVAAVCIAVSVYAGVVSLTIAATGDDDQVERSTLDSVWDELDEDGVLVGGGFEDRLGPETLPRGHRVLVNATVVGPDGHLVTVGAATFGTDARPTTLEPPPSAAVSDRPIPVRLGDGDVRPGRLTVVVWDG